MDIKKILEMHVSDEGGNKLTPEQWSKMSDDDLERILAFMGDPGPTEAELSAVAAKIVKRPFDRR